jgi:signal transduction histidine kinase
MLLVRESRRAGSLVADLLELARLDAGIELRRRPVRLRELADTQAERVRLVAPDLTVRTEGAEVEVIADPDRLAQVLANLLDNARQAGGTELRILVGPVDGHAVVVVEDNGPGVPIAERQRIFQRLVHSEHSRGSGLGLPIARGIARAHGGDLVCLDRADGQRGAAFRLTLP